MARTLVWVLSTVRVARESHEISGSHSRIFPQTRLYAIHREAIVLIGINRFGSVDAMRRDAMGWDAMRFWNGTIFTVCRPQTARPPGHLLDSAMAIEWWTGQGGRFPPMPGARESVIVFPSRGCGGGLGVCPIRGNILMSRSIIYVYMSASTCRDPVRWRGHSWHT